MSLNFGSWPFFQSVTGRPSMRAGARLAGALGEFASEPAATSNSTGLSSPLPKPKRTIAPSPEISSPLPNLLRMSAVRGP